MARRSHMFFLTAALTITSPLLQAAERKSLHGYADIPFGISESDLAKLRAIENRTQNAEGDTLLIQADRIEIIDIEFEVRYVMKSGKLTEIALIHEEERKENQSTKCDSQFYAIFGAVSARYGPPDGEPQERHTPISTFYKVLFSFQDASKVVVQTMETILRSPKETWTHCVSAVRYTAPSRGGAF